MAWKTHGWHPTVVEERAHEDGDAANEDARQRSTALRRAVGVFHGVPRKKGGHAWTKTATWVGGEVRMGNANWRPISERPSGNVAVSGPLRVGEPDQVG